MTDPVVARASLLAEAGQHQAALDTLSPWLASHPDDRQGLVVAGDSLNAVGRYDAALKLAYRVLASDPSDLSALVMAVTASLGRGDLKGAQDLADACLTAHPTLWIAHAQIVRVAIQRPRPGDRALACAREAVRLNPAAAAPHILLGEVWRLRGESREAKAEFRTALSIDPLSAEAANNLAIVMLRQRRAAAAVRAFGDILRRDPLYEVARINIGAAVQTAISNLVLITSLSLIAISVLRTLPTFAFTSASDDDDIVALSVWVAAIACGLILVLAALFCVSAGRRVIRYLAGPGRPTTPTLVAGFIAVTAMPTAFALAVFSPGVPPEIWGRSAVPIAIVCTVLLRLGRRRQT